MPTTEAEAAQSADAHRITISDAGAHVSVRIGSALVAESDRAKVLHEGKLPPRYYFPPEDVDLTLLTPTDTSTHCPFKGDASYWSVTVDGATHDDVVWAYDSPIPAAADIAGLMSFYDERVELVVEPTLDAS